MTWTKQDVDEAVEALGGKAKEYATTPGSLDDPEALRYFYERLAWDTHAMAVMWGRDRTAVTKRLRAIGCDTSPSEASMRANRRRVLARIGRNPLTAGAVVAQ